jgi:hypothetical protein
MWLELWNMARWLLGFWLLLVTGCAVIASRNLRPSPTDVQQLRIVAAPKHLFQSLGLEVQGSKPQPLKRGEARFSSFTDAIQDQHCAPFPGNAVSLENQLRRLPDDVFISDSPFQALGADVSFYWTIRDGAGARYTGLLETKKRRLCLEPTAFQLEWTPVLEQWRRAFVLALIVALPLYALSTAIFSLVLWTGTSRTSLQWLGALIFFPSSVATAYLAFWYFLFSLGAGI